MRRFPRNAGPLLAAIAAAVSCLSGPAQGDGHRDQSDEESFVDRTSLRLSFRDSMFDVASGSDPSQDQTTTVLQPDQPPQLPGSWTIQGGLYLSLTGMAGDASIAGTTANIDLSFSDIFDAFDIIAVSGRVEAWKDKKWGIVFDGMYLNLEADFPIPGPIPDISVDLSQAQIDLGLGYRVLDQPLRRDDTQWPRVVVDLLGGGRYQYFKSKLTVGPLQLGASSDWMEPFIGGRVWLQLNDKFAFVVRGDASGFGIGSASDLTWNLVAGINYRLKETMTLHAGYKVQGFEYSRGSGLSQFGADWTTQGLVLAMTWTF